MAIGSITIHEYDVVELMTKVGKWPAGTSGTVVVEDGAWRLIEISDENGQMLDLLEAPESKLNLVEKYS